MGPEGEGLGCDTPVKTFPSIDEGAARAFLDRMAVVWLKDPLLWGLFKVVT